MVQIGIRSRSPAPWVSVLRSVFLVFEFVEHDVGRLLDVAGVRFTTAEVKCLLHQLLRAVAYLHNRWILHRDLKMSNILLTDRCGRDYNPHDTGTDSIPDEMLPQISG